MKKIALYALSAAILLGGLTAFKPVPAKKQGIEGYIYKVTGNQMPSPDIKPRAPKGVKASLYIYQLTNTSQVVKKEGTSFYTSVSTKLIKKVQSNAKGYFNIQLAPGKYSVFLKKDTLLYANQFDGQNNVAPVEVKTGKMTKLEVKMDYDAVY